MLAVITFVSPWAKAVFQVGEPARLGPGQVELTDQTMTLPISFWDGFLRVDGCPRGKVEGLDQRLDTWILTGRVLFVGQLCLWFAFLFGAIFRSGYRKVAIWGAGWVLLFWIFCLLSNPVIECLYTQFPPPLVITGQWQISMISVLLFAVNILLGLWINFSILKMPFSPSPAFK